MVVIFSVYEWYLFVYVYNFFVISYWIEKINLECESIK